MANQDAGVWALCFITNKALRHEVAQLRWEALFIKAWLWLHTKAVVEFKEARRGEGVLACRKFVDDDARAPDVGGVRVVFPHGPLGRHVAGGADEGGCHADRGVQVLRDPEVGELHLALGVVEDVLRLHVAVEHPPRLQVMQAPGDLRRHAGQGLGGDALPVEAIPHVREAPPVHELDDHVDEAGAPRHEAGVPLDKVRTPCGLYEALDLMQHLSRLSLLSTLTVLMATRMPVGLCRPACTIPHEPAPSILSPSSSMSCGDSLYSWPSTSTPLSGIILMPDGLWCRVPSSSTDQVIETEWSTSSMSTSSG
eukprot:CAMPEP_0179359138 /NCGR_PEP_ID=MMETSP0797-20121207/79289_1 /TAXON_ID=47934 /ORGANISM="Dinophysis acuminata, Strain DAEP01" /LENGTH=309 /DNA_ID=CAMNT_0021074417 /DNA_START=148 /DNA_END=1075 /DNA_ORIENTATION=+